MTIKCQQENNSITTIGGRIKIARKAMKLTQAELADKLELTQGFIGHIENGRNMPTLDQINRMAIILDCNMTWLATGEGEMRQPQAERVTEKPVEFRIEGRVKGQKVIFSSKDHAGEELIIIDEQHRAMIELMETAPEKKSELLALVRGYLAGGASAFKQKWGKGAG